MTVPPTPRRPLPLVGIALSLLLAAGCSSADARAITTVIGPQATADLLAERDDLVVIDVRTPPEFADGHLAGATLIDVSAPEFDEAIGGLDRDTTYVLYCRSGNRSAVAAERMEAAGFTDLYDAGSFADLAAVGLPTG